MLRIVRYWSAVYWIAGIIFLAFDLTRAFVNERDHFVHQPFGPTEALTLLGLRALADLFVIAGLHVILTGLLASIRGAGPAYGPEEPAPRAESPFTPTVDSDARRRSPQPSAGPSAPTGSADWDRWLR